MENGTFSSLFIFVLHQTKHITLLYHEKHTFMERQMILCKFELGSNLTRSVYFTDQSRNSGFSTKIQYRYPGKNAKNLL